MKVKYVMMFICSLVLCLIGGTIYALSETSVTNHLDTGVVDVKLNEYQLLEDGSEVRFYGEKMVLPGMDISVIPKVYNEGTACYVRVKFDFININQLGDHSFIGLDKNWVKCADGYYYYTDILDSLETAKIFDGIHIPENLDASMQNQTFSMHIQLDAIQSRNFYPDFDKDNPWGDVEILECIQSGPYDIRVMTLDASGLQVVYQGEAKSLMAAPEDFFAGFLTMLPGDSYEATVELVNDGTQDRTLYFRTESLEESPLLEKILLEITTKTDGKTTFVYSGPLHSDNLQESVMLADLDSGESGIMNFKLTVPAELDNAFTLLDTNVKWIFSTLEMESESVKTGDREDVGLLFMIWGTALMVSVCVLAIKRFNKQLRKK